MTDNYPKLTETRKLRQCSRGCGYPTVFRDAKGRPLCSNCNLQARTTTS